MRQLARPSMIAVALALIVGVTSMSPAQAAPGDKVCWVVGSRFVCETDGGGGGGPPPADGGGGGVARPTDYWTVTLVPEQMGNGDTNAPCLDNGQPGRAYRYTLRDAATSEILETSTRCVANADPESVHGAPPSPPPTADELLGAAPIPEPAILANPGGRGLTGLESWFWAVDPGPVSVSVTIRGWTVAGTLTAEHWTWMTGDGGRYGAASPGSAERPAARHTYETKDTWPVTLDVTWSGTYTVSGWGTSFTVTGLATNGTSSLDYDVIEVRGVLDDPESGGSMP